jgi:hypothetical protein
MFRRDMTNRDIICEINDYISVDDFYLKLVERNSYIENNQVIDDFELARLNSQCLELAENALKKLIGTNTYSTTRYHLTSLFLLLDTLLVPRLSDRQQPLCDNRYL